MRKALFWAGMMLAVALASLACAPAAVPAPPPPAPAPAAAPAPAPSPQDTAWQKVVELAQKEGVVNAYSFTWTGDTGLAIARAFKQRYGIDIFIVTGRGAEFAERLKAERRTGQVVGDMTEGSSGLIHSMKLEGLLASVVDQLPALREKDVWVISPTFADPVDKANLGWRMTEYAPWINTKLVKPQEVPTSWKSLLAPRWKGKKMTLTEPRLNAALLTGFVALLDKKVWDEDYIKALYRQELLYPVSTVEESRMLSAGESDLAIRGTDASGASFVAQGAPIKAIDIKEGVPVGVSSIAVIAKGPHPNAAKLLVNWLLSPEGQAVAGQAQSNRMLRKDVADFRPPDARAGITNPIFINQEYTDEGTLRFRDRWFDKLVGR